MNSLDLLFEYRVITDKDEARGNDLGYEPVPTDKIIVEGNTIAIVGLVPPETLYQLRYREKPEDEWTEKPVWESDPLGVMRLGVPA